MISVSSGRFKTKPLRKLFFSVLLKRNVRQRALRTLKEGDFFFAGGYDRGCGISLIYWLPPPPSGLYKNTSLHKNLPANSLRNKIVKQPPPYLLALTLTYLDASVVQREPESTFGKRGC